MCQLFHFDGNKNRTMQHKSRWLLHPQYQSKVQIILNQPLEKSCVILHDLDFKHSAILRFFYFIIGLERDSMNLKGLLNLNFCLLSREPTKLILGVKGKFWRLKKVLLPINQRDFLKQESGYTQIEWTFNLENHGSQTTQLSFLVSIASPDIKTHRKMGFYWFFIKPVSIFIRKEMLKAMRRRLHEAAE
ncbi:MAG: hypothetical protein RIC03_02070 [Cyclobacteriaceae bacterium]